MAGEDARVPRQIAVITVSYIEAKADQYACFHSILETAKRNGASKFGTLYQLMIEDNPDSSFIDTITS